VSSELPWQHSHPLPDEDATYMLIPTSGTTGRPKAVRVTGRMTGHAAAFYARTLGLTAADRTAVHLPFGWVSGHVTQLTPAMLSGGSIVTMATFSGPALVQVCREHAVTWLDVVPSIWELLLRVEGFHADALPGVRLAVYGGAPAPAGTLDRVADRMPSLRLYDVYALSETCAPVTCLLDGERPRRPGSVVAPWRTPRSVWSHRTGSLSCEESLASCRCARLPSPRATGGKNRARSAATVGSGPATSGGWTARATSPSAVGPSTW